jgi:hypothetical protein
MKKRKGIYNSVKCSTGQGIPHPPARACRFLWFLIFFSGYALQENIEENGSGDSLQASAEVRFPFCLLASFMEIQLAKTKVHCRLSNFA